MPSHTFPGVQAWCLTFHFNLIISLCIYLLIRVKYSPDMSADISFEATAVVRSYSFEVERRLGEGIGARHLSQALVEQRNGGHLEDVTSPWRSFFEANNSNDSLMKDNFSIWSMDVDN